MLEIKITDPHLMDKKALLQTAKYLFELSGTPIMEVPTSNTNQAPVKPCPVPLPTPPLPPLLPPVPPTPFQKPLESANSVPPIPVNPFLKTPSTPMVSHNTITGVEVDASGLPWDGRIHSRTVSKTNDGLWRAKRGVDPALVTQVENELRNAMTAPVVAPIPKTENFIKEELIPVGPETIHQYDFPAFMSRMTEVISSGKMQQTRLIQIVQSFGLQSVPLVATRPDLIPAIIQAINTEVGV